MKKIEIKKGINLWLIPDGKFKTYYAGIFIHTELDKKTATENALIPLLLKRGSKNFPTGRKIAAELENLMGASLSAYTSKKGDDQMLCFTVTGASDEFSPFSGVTKNALGLLSDIVFAPIDPVDKKYLEGEKIHLSELIESEKNDKRAYASLRCREEMAKGTAYAVPENGYIEDIGEITAGSIKERIKEVTSSSPVDILVAGAFSEDEVIAEVKKIAEPLLERAEERPKSAPVAPTGERYVEETMKITQGKLSVGYTLPVFAPDDKLYPAAMMYNCIFGGSASSKLFLNVREKLSLAYYASSAYERAKGIVVVSSGIECKNFAAARDEIRAQFEEMKNGAITPGEIDTAKKCLINTYKSAEDSLKGVVSFYLGQIISGSDSAPEDMAKRILSVTKEEIMAVAAKVNESVTYFLKGGEN